MLELLLSKFGGWIAAIALAVAAIFGAYAKGRRTGQTQERDILAAKINERATVGRVKAQEAQHEVDRQSDDALLKRASDKWVRK